MTPIRGGQHDFGGAIASFADQRDIRCEAGAFASADFFHAATGQRLGEEPAADEVSQQASAKSGGVRDQRSDTQPLAGAFAELSDRWGNQTEDDQRHDEAEESGEDRLVGQEETSKPYGHDGTQKDTEHDGNEHPAEQWDFFKQLHGGPLNGWGSERSVGGHRCVVAHASIMIDVNFDTPKSCELFMCYEKTLVCRMF